MDWTPDAKELRMQLREAIRKNAAECRTVKIPKHRHVYTSGQRDETIYLVEIGKVKLLLPTPEGKECLLCIRAAGDIFGWMCLSGQPVRLETAVAMEDVVLKSMPARSFVSCLRRADLLESLIRFLAIRLSEQRELIAVLTTADSEHRLGEILLHLCRVLGRHNSHATHIEHRISHSELSAMVGTTRPRIGLFLQKFQSLGMVGITPERFFVVDEAKLRQYLLSSDGSEVDSLAPGKAGLAGRSPAIA